MDVVTICTIGARRIATGGTNGVPNRRGRESAARAGILWNLSTGQVMNRLFIYKRERLCI
ncbi:hypothetical protein NJ34_004438 [Salmonella enterica subsp. enterica]|nr:hypothetical protein [Salmonella enterica subsp. enterica]